MYKKCIMILALFLLVLPVISAQEIDTTEAGVPLCRADFTSMKDNAAPIQQLTPFVDFLLKQGYKVVTVYGYASTEETNPENLAMLRAAETATRISDLTDGQISAVPQLGFRGGSTDVFGTPADNQRIIVTANQLFQSEYTPAPKPGTLEMTDCPLVFFCNRAKLLRESWYCLRDDVWHGPCENDGCIGDTEFIVVNPRKQKELDNIIGDDIDSMKYAVKDLQEKADLLLQNHNYIRALENLQKAYEISGKIPFEQRDNFQELHDARTWAFELAVKDAKSDAKAERVIKVTKRSEKLTPDAPLKIEESSLTRLRQIVTGPGAPTTAVYSIIIIVAILAVIGLIHLLVHVFHARKLGNRKVLDEAAREIASDIELLEQSYEKKARLAKDSVNRLKALKTTDLKPTKAK